MTARLTAACRRLSDQLHEASRCFRSEWNPYIALMLRRAPRKPAVWLAVLVAGTLASLMVTGFFASIAEPGFRRANSPNDAGRMLIFGLAYMHFVFGPLVMMGLSTLAFKSEYQRRTLEGVLVAPMTPLELVAKKSAQIWLPLLLISTLLLPFYALAMLAGGVGLDDVFRWWLLLTIVVSLQIPPAVFAFPLRRTTHLNRWMGWRILLYECLFVFLPMFGNLFAGAGRGGPPPWMIGLVNFMGMGRGGFGLVGRVWHGMWHSYPFFAFALPPWLALLAMWLPTNLTKAYHSAFVIALLPSLNLGPTPTRPKPGQFDDFETPPAAAELQRRLMKCARLVQFFTTLVLFGYLWPPLVTSGVMAGVLVPGLRDVGVAMASLTYLVFGLSLLLAPMVVPLPQSQLNIMFLGDSAPLGRRVRSALLRPLVSVPLFIVAICILGWQSPLQIPLALLAPVLVLTMSALGLRAAVDAFIEVAGRRFPWIVRGPGDVIYVALMLAPFALLLCPLPGLRYLCVASPLFGFASLTPWTNQWLAAFSKVTLHPLPSWHLAPLLQLPLAALLGGITWHLARAGDRAAAPIDNPRRESLTIWLLARLQRWWDNPVSTISLRRQVRRGVWDTPVLATIPLLLWVLVIAVSFPYAAAWTANRLIPGLVVDCGTEDSKSLRLAMVIVWVVLSLESFAAALLGYAAGCSEDAKRTSANFAMLTISPLTNRAALFGYLSSALLATVPVALSCVPFLLGVPLLARDGAGLTLAMAGLACWAGFLLVEVMFVLLFPMFGSVGQVLLGVLLFLAALGQAAWALMATERSTIYTTIADRATVLGLAALLWSMAALVLFGACWQRLSRLRRSDLSLGAAVEN